MVGPITECADFAHIWRVGLEGLAALDDDERTRFIVFSFGAMRFFEASRLQWRHRQLDVEHWQNVEAFLRDLAERPGIADFWAVRGHMHSTEFRTWFESLPRTAPVTGFYDVVVGEQAGASSHRGQPLPPPRPGGW